MAKQYVYLKGKAKWARLVQPDMEYNKWSVVLYLDEESQNIFHKLKEAPAIMNQMKNDDDGNYVTLSRPVSRDYGSEIRAFTPPLVLKPDGTPCTELIGNGSDLTCKLEVYGWPARGARRAGRAIRLDSVRVDNLVPYTPKKDFTEEEHEKASGLVDQPAPF